MSGKYSAATSIQAPAQAKPVLRYAAGATIIMLVAMMADYKLSYLTPVLALSLLAPGIKPLTIKTGLAFLLTIATASISGLLFTRMFINYPLVFLPLIVLAVFHIYYTQKFQKMKVWLIISILVIPMASMQSPVLGSTIALNLFINAFIAVILVTIVNLIFPFEPMTNGKAVPEAPVQWSPYQRYIAARNKILVVMPVLMIFFIFNLSGALLVLIFITILSMNPATASKKAGMAIILSNFGGGMAAILAFNLLTIVPEVIFLGMLVLLAGLLFGKGLFSGKPVSQMFGMAYSTFLLILGNVTSFRGEAGEEVWTRIMQLGIVVVYIVIAFALVDYYSGRREKTLMNG